VSRQIIAEIKRVAGEKPIRYVVISHFHSDHAGGVGAYTDIGATVVSAAENESVLRTYAQARSLSQGLAGARAAVPLTFLPVGADGRDIVDAAGHRLRVIDFKTPHVERLLALYDPETRTVINGDLFSRLVLWNKTFDVFARWLRRNDPPVETILGTHHAPMSRDELLTAARESARK
jgi:glyoxylase-like metal-dependent hydrolase (beta-lactamase superfamily II)